MKRLLAALAFLAVLIAPASAAWKYSPLETNYYQKAMLFTGTSAATVACYAVDPATGWTKTCVSGDSNVIYVSDSLGLDTYDGTLPAHTTGIHGPVKTLAYATTNTTIGTLGTGLRVAKPDWLLLRKGDTWLDQILGNYSYVGVMLASGRSATEPLLIGAYSDTGVSALIPQGTGTGARPLLKGGLTNAQRAFGFGFTFGTTQDTWQVLDYFAVIGLEFYDYRRNPSDPGYDPTVLGQAFISISNPTNWWLVEDSKFSYGQAGIGTGGNTTQSITASVAGSGGSTAMNVTAVATSGFVGLNTAFSGGALRVVGSGLVSFPGTYINYPASGTGTGGAGGTYGISNFTYTVVENGTATLTGFPNFGTSYAAGLTPGIGTLSVSGTNIPASTTVASIPATFNMTGTLNGTTTVSGLSSTAAPMYVGASVSGANIPNGTTVASISNGTTILLSAAATGSGSTSLQFMPNAVILNKAATGSGTFNITFDQNAASGTLTVTDDEGRHSVAHQSISVRRNITAYNYPLTNPGDPAFGVGMLLSQILNLNVEGNYAIHDGYLDNGFGEVRNTFNHGHYIHENDNSFAPGQTSNEQAIGNTYINNSFAGVWCRSCRLADNNLAYGNTMGIGYGYGLATPANPTNAITNNVIMQSVASTTIAGSPTWGLDLNSTRTGTVPVPVHNNLIANAVQPDPTGTNNYNAVFIGVSGVSTPPQQVAASITGNTFCNWPLASGSATGVTDFTPLKLNVISPNVDQPSNCTGLGPAPTRDLASYSLSLGGANSVDGYIALIMGTPGTLSGQSRDNWNPSVTAAAANNYFRAGYGLTTYP